MKNVVSSSCIFALVWVFLATSFAQATELPEEHEQARLMLLLDASVMSENWDKTSRSIDKLKQLDVDLPDSFYYFEALYLRHAGQLDLAISSLSQYVIEAGKEGEFYNTALVLISELEENTEESSRLQSPSQPQAESKASLEGHSKGYVQALQALYLTSDAKSALVQQINSVLSAHAYRDSRIQGKVSASGIEYQVSVDGHMLMLQERSYMADVPSLRLDKLKVLGVDPFLEYDCDSSPKRCTIFHPAKEKDRWIVIANDEMAVQELIEAFSHLIRLIQH